MLLAESNHVSFVYEENECSLVVLSAGSQDGGVYTCTARNLAGEVSCKAELSVHSGGLVFWGEETGSILPCTSILSFAFLDLSHLASLCPCLFLVFPTWGHLSPPQLRQPWRSRESERTRSTEEEGLATTTTSTKRLAGVGRGRAGFKEQEGLLGLRVRKERGSAL